MVLPHEIIIQPALRPNLEKAFGSNASLRGSTEAAAPLRLVCSFCSAANALFYASAAEQFSLNGTGRNHPPHRRLLSE